MATTGTDLHADCINCFGLCCVGLAFAKSSDFAFDKPIGTPCHNLKSDYLCGIHTELRKDGMAGCTVFDCFGAGQKISQVTFHGRSWRDNPVSAPQMFLAFSVMRPLHELLWYITDAISFAPEGAAIELQFAFDNIEELTNAKPAALLRLDIKAKRDEVNILLQQASEIARANITSKCDYTDANLNEKQFAGVDLRGSTFRNAELIRTNFRGSDLRSCDFLGAKMRSADVSGADLSSAMFLTQMQINATDGDATTLLPERLQRPGHWK